jgi:hypothetical protein
MARTREIAATPAAVVRRGWPRYARGVPGDVYPRHAPRSRVSAAEVAVWEAMRKALPTGWRAWHSLRLRGHQGYEGEGDFVVAVPDRGLLVLEVKGGRMELRDGRWSQNGRALVKAPREQAQTFVRRLTRTIDERCGWRVPFGVACVFPDVDFSDGPGGGDLAGLVMGPRHLAYLAEALPAVFARAVPRATLEPDGAWLEVLHELWGETWVPTVSLDDEVRDGDARMIALADEQLRVLAAAADNHRAVVTGGAGAGKTLIARELCRRAARRGERALYLCFTDALGLAVDRGFAAERAEGVWLRAAPIRRHAAGLLAARGVEVDARDPAFWDTASLAAACNALPPEDEQPDLVVVDEAQDFDAGDWDLVAELAGPRALWIFGDARQAYWERPAIPAALTAGAVRLRLAEQRRNPPAIAAFAARYAATDAGVGPGLGPLSPALPPLASALAPAAPSGDDGATVPDGPRVLRIVDVPDGASELATLEAELRGFLARGARPEDLAVLTLAGQTASALLRAPTLADLRAVRADAPDAAQHVVADTFLRFKGLERPFVFLVELAAGHARHYDRRMHMAATRATARLTVLVTPAAAGADARLHAAVAPTPSR